MKFKNEPRHESYGLINLSRISGHTRLYASPIESQHFIQLTLMKGSTYYGLGDDHQSEGQLIAKVWMSEVQFAQMLTTMNYGVGTPCTLKYVPEDGAKLHQCEEPPQQISTAMKVREDFKARVEDSIGAMKGARRKIDALLDEAAVSKGRREEIKATINEFFRLFSDSAPFMMERFEENASKVVSDAKAEITAHADQVIREAGMEALASAKLAQIAQSVDGSMEKAST